MATLPSLETEQDGITPKMPPGAYPEDYKDDWINLVSRRLAKKLPDLSAGQRKVLASVAFTRKYRRMQVECPRCHGNGYEPTYNNMGSDDGPTCKQCDGSGNISRPTARYIGRDARTRPVLERLEFGKWRRWAVGRSGDPVDPAEPITEGKPW